MLRIATINNLSAKAYELAIPDFPVRMTRCSPAGCYEQLKAGLCDAALLPVARLEDCAPLTQPVGAYGIACEGKVFSVLLFARYPLRRILDESMPVYVTGESQTSRLLLPVLCCMEFGKMPVLTSSHVKTEARLLIGDKAMDTAREEYRWPVVKDLGQWWHDRTGQPFVFARWVMRRDVPPFERKALLHWLEKCTALAETEAGVKRLAESALRDGLFDGSSELAMLYYRRIRPRLTLRDLHGLRLFLEKGQEAGVCAKTA